MGQRERERDKEREREEKWGKNETEIDRQSQRQIEQEGDRKVCMASILCTPCWVPPGPSPALSFTPSGISSPLLVPEVTPHAQIRSRTKEAVSWQTSSAMVCGGGGEVTRLMPEVERERTTLTVSYRAAFTSLR